MKGTRFWISVMVLAAVAVPGAVSAQTPLGTAFTYQGRLIDDGRPADGDYDFQFTLYDDPIAGAVVCGPIDVADEPVVDGLFTVTLDCGSDVFACDARWLEIGVRPWNSGGPYTVLAPRQEMTPVAYALALPGLWTQQNATSPNIIGGYCGNSVTGGVSGATIGGGGNNANINQVTDQYGTVGGGDDNQAGDNAGAVNDATYATVGGGGSNTASNYYATVGGGYNNVASNGYATVGGGCRNEASNEKATVGGGWYNEASGEMATIAGGRQNIASASRSTVGGGYNNVASNGIATVCGGEGNEAGGWGATVAGGGNNSATGIGAAISGGGGNIAPADYAAIGGGRYNDAQADYATISGGGRSDTGDPSTNNRVTDNYGTVGGGGNNKAGFDDGDTTNQMYATVAGGEQNTATGHRSTVGGGGQNSAVTTYTTVSGGTQNRAEGEVSTIGGGYANGINGAGHRATIGGGELNSADGWYNTIGGGTYNTTSLMAATVGGGSSNNASGDYAVVAGGYDNSAGANYATVPGGAGNTAGGHYSFAAGRRAQANHQGTFVWADSGGVFFTSTGNDQFLIHADGNVGIGVDDPTEQIDTIGTARLRGIEISGLSWPNVVVDDTGKLWEQASSRRYKTNIENLETNPDVVLKLRPVSFQWKTTGQQDIGLIAEEVDALLKDLVMYDKEGKPKSVKYDRVAVYLLAVVKAQQSRIEALEKKVQQRQPLTDTTQQQDGDNQ